MSMNYTMSEERFQYFHRRRPLVVQRGKLSSTTTFQFCLLLVISSVWILLPSSSSSSSSQKFLFADAFSFGPGSIRSSSSLASFSSSSSLSAVARRERFPIRILMSTNNNKDSSKITTSTSQRGRKAADKKINNTNNNNGSRRRRPPARIRASKTSTVRVQSPSPKTSSSSSSTTTSMIISLDDYMKLPAAQYTCVPMPLNSSLERVRGTKDRFQLVVPPMKLQSPGVPLVEVRPVVMATVTVEPDKERVRICSDSCQIGGSKIIDDLNINNFFEFSVEICLTWDNNNNNNNNTPGGGGGGGGIIKAQSEIAVDLNPPGPFALVPRRILEAVGNRAIALTLGSLQQNFMISLGKDFEKWVTDESYRIERQKLEDDLDEEMMMLLYNYNGSGSSSDIPLDDSETLMAYLDRC